MTHHRQPHIWAEHALPEITPAKRAKGQSRMYSAVIATVFASTIFFPSFIGIRARTNGNWRSL